MGFMQMSDDVMNFLKRNGYKVETKDKDSPKLTAFRRNIYFPNFLFDRGLSGHRDERFLIKIEAQDQGVIYRRGYIIKSDMLPISTIISMFHLEMPLLFFINLSNTLAIISCSDFGS